MTIKTATVTVPLSNPIKIGDKDVSELNLRRPNAGDLRGVKLMQLAEMDTDFLFKLLPRITTPMLAESHVQMLDPSDAIKIMAQLNDFFTG